jgi:hypothetical protein
MLPLQHVNASQHTTAARYLAAGWCLLPIRPGNRAAAEDKNEANELDHLRAVGSFPLRAVTRL